MFFIVLIQFFNNLFCSVIDDHPLTNKLKITGNQDQESEDFAFIRTTIFINNVGGVIIDETPHIRKSVELKTESQKTSYNILKKNPAIFYNESDDSEIDFDIYKSILYNSFDHPLAVQHALNYLLCIKEAAVYLNTAYIVDLYENRIISFDETRKLIKKISDQDECKNALSELTEIVEMAKKTYEESKDDSKPENQIISTSEQKQLYLINFNENLHKLYSAIRFVKIVVAQNGQPILEAFPSEDKSDSEPIYIEFDQIHNFQYFLFAENIKLHFNANCSHLAEKINFMNSETRKPKFIIDLREIFKILTHNDFLKLSSYINLNHFFDIIVDLDNIRFKFDDFTLSNTNVDLENQHVLSSDVSLAFFYRAYIREIFLDLTPKLLQQMSGPNFTINFRTRKEALLRLFFLLFPRFKTDCCIKNIYENIKKYNKSIGNAIFEHFRHLYGMSEKYDQYFEVYSQYLDIRGSEESVVYTGRVSESVKIYTKSTFEGLICGQFIFLRFPGQKNNHENIQEKKIFNPSRSHFYHMCRKAISDIHIFAKNIHLAFEDKFVIKSKHSKENDVFASFKIKRTLLRNWKIEFENMKMFFLKPFYMKYNNFIAKNTIFSADTPEIKLLFNHDNIFPYELVLKKCTFTKAVHLKNILIIKMNLIDCQFPSLHIPQRAINYIADFNFENLNGIICWATNSQMVFNSSGGVPALTLRRAKLSLINLKISCCANIFNGYKEIKISNCMFENNINCVIIDSKCHFISENTTGVFSINNIWTRKPEIIKFWTKKDSYIEYDPKIKGLIVKKARFESNLTALLKKQKIEIIECVYGEELLETHI